eukprot:m.231463 g.231463  ORF g.231463 m.231463 type:complete len:50 (-) comp18875_c0_seq1:2621-2770(-)
MHAQDQPSCSPHNRHSSGSSSGNRGNYNNSSDNNNNNFVNTSIAWGSAE